MQWPTNGHGPAFAIMCSRSRKRGQSTGFVDNDKNCSPLTRLLLHRTKISSFFGIPAQAGMDAACWMRFLGSISTSGIRSFHCVFLLSLFRIYLSTSEFPFSPSPPISAPSANNVCSNFPLVVVVRFWSFRKPFPVVCVSSPPPPPSPKERERERERDVLSLSPPLFFLSLTDVFNSGNFPAILRLFCSLLHSDSMNCGVFLLRRMRLLITKLIHINAIRNVPSLWMQYVFYST